MPGELKTLPAKIMELGLRMLEREYEEESVRVMVVEDVGKILTPEGIIELSKGSEYTLPRWIARELAERGCVKFIEEEINLEKLAKIAYSEESMTRRLVFEKLHPYFYKLTKDVIEELYKVLERERQPRILAEIQKHEEYLSRISRVRLRKILNLLMIEAPYDLITKLSEEEKLLYDMLKATLSSWTSRLRIEKGV